MFDNTNSPYVAPFSTEGCMDLSAAPCLPLSAIYLPGFAVSTSLFCLSISLGHYRTVLKTIFGSRPFWTNSTTSFTSYPSLFSTSFIFCHPTSTMENSLGYFPLTHSRTVCSLPALAASSVQFIQSDKSSSYATAKKTKSELDVNLVETFCARISED